MLTSQNFVLTHITNQHITHTTLHHINHKPHYITLHYTRPHHTMPAQHSTAAQQFLCAPCVPPLCTPLWVSYLQHNSGSREMTSGRIVLCVLAPPIPCSPQYHPPGRLHILNVVRYSFCLFTIFLASMGGSNRAIVGCIGKHNCSEDDRPCSCMTRQAFDPTGL